MDRLRTLSESDCYTRLYGQRDPTVTVIARRPRAQSWQSVTGEELREAFDERLDAREPLNPFEAEAA
jgi:hypothetical protein